ncbi:Type 4 prepilin-like proteins leader peptide-processing enzyme [Acidithiobacillus ferrivorans]|uniref:Prepilin leader peptidase/N-methyltransferase n=1 Tax=Acidithiobacillus ferrivorans TaxID=160808 RepID=A0A060UPA8_9PROT|nr:A24 family peptidase [Acidithiobacillus ferrivorans]CDQ10437.1 Type 4 prepilin-like proteins leader peptide-processing enzyme [Acidithiobacillus ferrivorans]SMH64463.1 Type 4 prepilin-like proteins leader peptide-processing enzyme [Acidithiobacillus ferrivorans]
MIFDYIVVGILGLIVGSFLNVVVHRVPRRESIVTPGSHCPSCEHSLRPWENIPVLSWVFLRGRCHGCGAAIAWRYPALELLSGLLALVIFSQVWLTAKLPLVLVFTWILLALTLIDLETHLLPDRITKPGILAGLLLNGSVLFWPSVALTSPLNALLGVIVGYGCLWLLSAGCHLATGRHGMGGGDLKLLGMIGAWLGWQAILLALFIAAISGGLVAVIYLLSGKGRDYAMPFGPYLALGGWLMLLWPEQIIHGYMHILM